MNQKFSALDKDRKPYLGLKMYNIAQKELIYATESEEEKEIAIARADIEKSQIRLNDTDREALTTICIDANTIKTTDVSLPYLFGQAVVNQKLSSDYVQIFTDLKNKFRDFIEKFTNETTITTFVNELKGIEITNVNSYANILTSYHAEINLSAEDLTKGKHLYNKTKKVILFNGNNIEEIPVTEEQYQDGLLALQMEKDCFVCSSLKDYKLKLKETKANFYTQKIIEEILNIEIETK